MGFGYLKECQNWACCTLLGLVTVTLLLKSSVQHSPENSNAHFPLKFPGYAILKITVWEIKSWSVLNVLSNLKLGWWRRLLLCSADFIGVDIEHLEGQNLHQIANVAATYAGPGTEIKFHRQESTKLAKLYVRLISFTIHMELYCIEYHRLLKLD